MELNKHMAHHQQQAFLLSIKNKFPEKFKFCNVLDIGSLDINGNNRYLFEEYTYTGIDIGPGNNVDIICKGHEFKSDNLFDIVISTECFEHDFFYKQTIANAIKLTKSNGMFIFTCASTGRQEHGTRRTNSSGDSPFSNIEWDDYYQNLTEQDVRDCVDIDNIFVEHHFEYNPWPGDLYFYGIKK